ncbi:HNH endonuclease [Arthrobacter agilis]|nr:HNH endonuclease signature motif containing protein [Arthrobacter agilis]OUM45699.1 hypothetical protein B8W74_00025 [Arthrobacter agilis]PPB47825.1 HNH endonuclease [Arthrobacter agilis]TPV21356.1 HNH endonuclease [Arthrobacter agilis]
MATSRTGTSQWLKLAQQAKYLALRGGLNNCRFCGVELNYRRGRLPNSAEVDHILPVSRGGQDAIENLRADTCRTCNRRKGARLAPRGTPPQPPKDLGPLKTTRQW